MRSIQHPDRKQQPALGHQVKLTLPPVEKIKLDNGLEFFLLPDQSQDVTRIDFVFDAGSVHQEKMLQAATVNQLLSEGTRNHSSMEIAEILDFHGAYLDHFLTKDSAGLSLFSLTKYAGKILPFMVEMVTEAIFPEEEMNIFVDRRRQQFLVNIQKVNYRASMEFNRMIFGAKSAYGRTLHLNDFDHLNRIDCIDFYKKYYQPAGFYGLLSGKVTEELIQQLNATLGQIRQPEQNTLPELKEIINPSSENLKFISQKKALQSALRMGCLTIDHKHADYPRLSLLNTVLGGYFGSRLMSSIREDKGYTYGIHSFLQQHRHGGFFGIATEVNAQNTAAALDEIKIQIEKLRTEKISDQELETVKNYVYGSYLRNFDGSFVLAERFLKSRELQMPFESFGQLLNQMMSCTAEELLLAAKQYLNPEKMKTLIVGNTADFKK
jgi:zinc protease